MAQFNLKDFVYHYRDGKPMYYSYNEELYCGTFPEEWAENHLPNTGPKDCINCAYYGSWNGVFLGYCVNCAEYAYNGTRGRGIIDLGKENDTVSVLDCPSIFETYMKDVSLSDVGDADFVDSSGIVDSYCRSKFEDFLEPEEKGNLTFSEKYPDIDIDEINDYYDEMFRRENEQDERANLYYSCNYDGGYDSY
jgi:hypothetical protein